MLKYRDFSLEHPEDPERGMREALAHAVATSGRAAKYVAAELGLAPDELSRMIAAVPSEDHYQRRAIPPGTLVRLVRVTQDYSPVATLLSYLGYNPARLVEIRRDEQAVLRELAEGIRNVNRIATQLGMLGVPDRPRGKRK